MEDDELKKLNWFDNESVNEGVSKIRALIKQDDQCKKIITILIYTYYFAIRDKMKLESFIQEVTEPLPDDVVKALEQDPSTINWVELRRSKISKK
ncbi:MAG: hypothetical protein L3J39_01250 [Verrucomicrobiales bacterium]|nr:hypothetical protein [Verrucomicrobiales bacterium]